MIIDPTQSSPTKKNIYTTAANTGTARISASDPPLAGTEGNVHGAQRRKDTLLAPLALGLHEAAPQVAAEEAGAAPRVLQLDREERPGTARITVACSGRR
jgi:hypothetical protein